MRKRDPIIELTIRVIEDHLLTGPIPGQCRCGYGGPDQPVPLTELAKPHGKHLAEKLREAGVLKEAQ